jgi:hypothetical protein
VKYFDDKNMLSSVLDALLLHFSDDKNKFLTILNMKKDLNSNVQTERLAMKMKANLV